MDDSISKFGNLPLSILTKRQLKDLTLKAFEDLGFKKLYHQINDISFNNRLRSSGAVTKITGYKDDLNIRIQYNPTIKMKEALDVARHEAAHVITLSGDNEELFQVFCDVHGIPKYLKEDPATSPQDKYRAYCPNCGNEWFYKRKGKTVKGIESSFKTVSCQCGEELKLEYLKRSESSAK